MISQPSLIRPPSSCQMSTTANSGASGAEPYPALVFDRRWNIVMTNHAVNPFFAPGSSPPAAASDQPQPARAGPARPGVHGRQPGRRTDGVPHPHQPPTRRRPDPGLTALYEDLLAPRPEEGPSQRDEADVVIPMILRMNGRELRLFSTITTFGTPMDITLDEVAIESYYPADAESAAYFTETGTGRRAEP